MRLWRKIRLLLARFFRFIPLPREITMDEATDDLTWRLSRSRKLKKVMSLFDELDTKRAKASSSGLNHTYPWGGLSERDLFHQKTLKDQDDE